MFELNAGQLPLDVLRKLISSDQKLCLSTDSLEAINASQKVVADEVAAGNTHYGINTGFGKLADQSIAEDQLSVLQSNLVRSHAAGVGEYLSIEHVKLIMLLKINSLSRGYSGVRSAVIEQLIQFYNQGIYPCIPSQGSVGASGDLAPLAHMSLALIGEGEVSYQHQVLSAKEVLSSCGLTPLILGPKEGLGLINGTQVSSGIALSHLFRLETLFESALEIAALAVDAAKGSDSPFKMEIQDVRGHAGQVYVAHRLRDLLSGSQIRASHTKCDRIQDPYSLRCIPQVLGACWDLIQFVANTLEIEANAVTDNPLVFSHDHSILSGGNFHAQPVAFGADQLALAIAEIGSMSERRAALLIDPATSGLPAFLIQEGGLNSGLMIAQVTAAALVSENKMFAHPASIDSIPTSANQEDHVSMATHAARRLGPMIANLENIIAIELLCASQAIEFHRPLKTSEPLEALMSRVRAEVTPMHQDRVLAKDIAKVRGIL